VTSPVSRHRYPRRVQFAETDLAGMVHFSWYARYVEEAEHALWRAAGLSIADPASPVGFPRVAFSIEYHAPLRFEDEFEVDIAIEAISKRTIRYRSVVRRGETAVATSTHTAVCVSRGRDLKAVDIPAGILERLSPGSGLD
jgi:YbgC/YbaW family acyl-CoA thioester hydrolase